MKNEYYSLKEIESLTDLKYRQLQNRILTIQEKYKNDKQKIFKLNNRWYISKSILFEFERKKYPISYKLFTTISSKNNYDFAYWNLLIRAINKEIYNNLDKYNRTRFVVENTKKGLFHLHFLTTYNNKKLLKNLINNNIYINNNDMNILIKSVYDVDGIHIYFRKENSPTLIKKHF